MRYIKITLWISMFVCAGPVLAQGDEVESCLERGKQEFAAEQYAQAKKIFEHCLTLDRTNEDTLLSLGGVCLQQEKLEEAREYFLSALKQMKRTSPYLSYTYSMLGDIALKQKQNKTALEYYNRSLSFNEAYTNSLVGKGVVLEEEGDKKEAARVYKTALSVEPLNVVARKHLVALEPVYFSDEEILEALKQRYAIAPDKESLSKDDRELFLKIHATEQRGGINYLKEKYPRVPPEYLTTLFDGTSFSRDVLTLEGYNVVQKRLGQDAIALFERTGISLKDIFELRDLRGGKIFTPESTLTDSGLVAYNEALKGRRMFLLPSEDVPPTRADINKINSRVAQLKQRGYTEISRRELDMLKKQTHCTEEVLRKNLGLYILPISRHAKRYFVISGDKAGERKSTAWYYVAKSRAKKDPSIKVPANNFVSSYESINYSVCSTIDGELLE